jgi:hypothetical protein
MPKTTIYLPDLLAAEVKECEINVSAVCQKALQAEVARIQSELSPKTRKIANRLKKTRREEDEDYQYGKSMGMQWAELLATFDELEWVADSGSLVYELKGNEHSLAAFLLTDQPGDPEEGTVKIDVLHGDPFSKGVVDGAREVWHRVSPVL